MPLISYIFDGRSLKRTDTDSRLNTRTGKKRGQK